MSKLVLSGLNVRNSNKQFETRISGKNLLNIMTWFFSFLRWNNESFSGVEFIYTNSDYDVPSSGRCFRRTSLFGNHD